MDAGARGRRLLQRREYKAKVSEFVPKELEDHVVYENPNTNLFSDKTSDRIINTINKASDAFKNNSKLNAERASLNATKQDVNISRGEFLPSVTISGNISSQEDTNRTNQSGEKLANINSTPETRSVLIEQKIFSGFSNYNNLKKSQLELEYAKYELTKLEQEVILLSLIHI